MTGACRPGVIILLLGMLSFCAPLRCRDGLPVEQASFWTGRLSDPERIVMTAPEISAFNESLVTAGLICSFSPSGVETVSTTRLQRFFSAALFRIEGKRLCLRNGSPSDHGLPARLKKLMGKPDGTFPVAYGIAAAFTNVRLLPSSEGLYRAGTSFVDLLQNDGFDRGTPLRILQNSIDGKWFFVETPASRGWVSADHVALCSRDELAAFFARPFAVFINVRNRLTADAEGAGPLCVVRMGTRLPLDGTAGSGVVRVVLPVRTGRGTLSLRTAYAPSGTVSEGFLPYTPGVVIRQAMKFLDEPYGWGDLNERQDCSGFIQDVFATVGVLLPRDSSDQAGTGTQACDLRAGTTAEERILLLKKNAVEGVTLLGMPGHMMLYLGMDGDVPYVIHELLACRENNGGKIEIRIVNRAVVSDLSLGKGTSAGTYLERLTSARVIR